MLKALFCCLLSVSLFAKAPVLVGIAGGTASGKTTLANKLHQAFPGSILVSQDSYYRDLSHLSAQERAATNFDHPDSLELSLLKNHLIDLKNGQSIESPTYDFCTDNRKKETTTILSAEVVLVEGSLLLAIADIRDLLDIKIFVEADDDIRMIRRFERDMKERGRDFESTKTRFLKTVKPMHEAFIEPSKKYADIIVPEGGYNEVAISMILAKLNEYTAKIQPFSERSSTIR